VLGDRQDAHARRVLIELAPETGRPHQLRVALATLGAPILGDLRYGAATPLADQSIALHAARLTVAHPIQRVEMSFECPPPERPWWSFPGLLEMRRSGTGGVEPG
jgi:23S rRNA pseudouridine1911/1915/1917 synthase